MGRIRPDLAWYTGVSQQRGVAPRCPFATVHRCPRYYQSLRLLGESGGATQISVADDEVLRQKWQNSDMWPVTGEQATSIFGPEGDPKMFNNFCPEAAYDRFGWFATNLYHYSDELDVGAAHAKLGREGTHGEDWRWAWQTIHPIHFTECPVYSLLLHPPLAARHGGHHVGYTANVVKVMIASPSDVAQERHLIRDVIQEWNAIHAEDRKLILMPVGWETHSAPDMGDRPQAIINRQLLKTCDLLVAVFWTRLGSPTPAAASGTVEEINEHLASGKPAMIYFSTVPVRMDSVDSEQYEKLRAFKEELRQRGLIAEYEDLTTFRAMFARHLAQTVIRDFAKGEAIGEADRPSPVERLPDLSEAARDLLLEAVQDPGGVIMRLGTMGGTHVQTNQRGFVEAGNIRSAARWRGAVDELHKLGLVEDRAGKGEVFFVTDAGYRAADLLRAA